MWPRRLIDVPTSALWVDPAVAADSSHGYSEARLRDIAAAVDQVNQRRAQGWTPDQFAAARQSDDPGLSRLGDTYARLCQSPSGEALRADWDGHDLKVDAGNHRVRAARAIGVSHLPVWVAAPTEAELDRVEQACARRRQREDPSLSQSSSRTPGPDQTPERSQTPEPERTPEPDRDRTPQRDRTPDLTWER
ncbi:MAG: hypothetical protein LBJ44_02795 [Propionibacteriaceae bacterium]|jgi:hypothetical protein|nr:hypothetical protein [Propionibacteriaceae bacterium]